MGFHDGLKIVFAPSKMTASSLKEEIKNRHEISARSTAGSFEDRGEIVVGGTTGYVWFSEANMGNSLHYYFPLSGQQYLRITVQAPGPDALFYNQIADQIISTLQFR